MNHDGDRGKVTVDVELTEPLVEMINRTKSDDVSLAEWVAHAAETRFTLYNAKEFDAPVDVPEEAVEWGELRAEHARLKGKDDVHLLDYVCEHTALDFQLPADEEEEEEAEES